MTKTNAGRQGPLATPLRLLAVVVFILPATGLAQDWRTWRGTDGAAIAGTDELRFPWSDDDIRWQVKLPSGSNSSPIVCQGKVFVTAASSTGSTRSLMAIDRRDGSVAWTQSVNFTEQESTHPSNPSCSASPVTDGDVVCASFGSAGLIGCSIDGDLLWKVDLGRLEHVFGNASSPVLHHDLCILWCGPGSRQFLLAVDKRTGEELWRYDVPGGKPDYNAPSDCIGSWATPIVANVANRDQLIVNAPEQLISLDPATGNLLWSCRGLGKLAYASPVIWRDLVVSPSGFHGPMLAVKATGKGDVTDTHVAWRHDDRQPQRIGSPIVVDDKLYIINENGVAETFDLATGEPTGASTSRVCSQTWSSPIVAGGNLLITSLRGELNIVRADPSLEIVARHRLNERVASSPAVSGSEIFVRGYEHLYCINTASSKSGSSK